MKKEIEIFHSIPGGSSLIEWWGGSPNFSDAEITSLHLNREGPSFLCLIMERHNSLKKVTFELGQWIDVSISGFNHQNVIGSLRLKISNKRNIEDWEKGVMVNPGQFEIEILPCFGACGTIRANLTGIKCESVQTA